MFVNQNIRYLRKKLKLSQTELSGNTGISMAAISSYERGKTEPSIDNLAAFAKFFKVSVDELIFTDLTQNSPDHPDPGKKSALDYADDLNEKRMTYDQVEQEVGKGQMQRIIDLQELRLKELEREIKKNNPDLAKELGIK